MKKAMVYGGGKSGLGAMNLLKKQGLEVILLDDRLAEKQNKDNPNKAIKSEEAMALLSDIELFVKSPGIPYTDLVKKARNAGIQIVDEIEIGYRWLKQNSPNTNVIAVTGTNGKTTVTTKITELLNYAGYKARFAGNIGVSFAELLLNEADLDYVVLELSSFELENLDTFRANIAMITNLTPDHLERYDSLEDYYETKFNIIRNAKESDIFIRNLDSQEIMDIFEELSEENHNYKNINIVDVSQHGDFLDFLDKDMLTLKGKHNLENMLFIVATGKLVGIDEDTIARFLYTTDNIEHRMEKCHKYGNIIFVNDSKGTNIESTKYAIEAFPQCTLICGGYDKKLDWQPLIDLIVAHVGDVYLIGDVAQELHDRLTKTIFPQNHIFMLKDIKSSLMDMKARYNKNQSRVVLLSPATSSYDQFKNFEERGRYFKEQVKTIFGDK